MNTPKRVLLVDDDPDIRAMIAAMLSQEAYEITEAESASVAINELNTAGPFDLAILDFWLGKNHSVSIMDEMAAKGANVPIIMISGGNRSMDLELTEAISDISGAVVFLQKPFQKTILLDAVRSALRS